MFFEKILSGHGKRKRVPGWKQTMDVAAIMYYNIWILQYNEHYSPAEAAHILHICIQFHHYTPVLFFFSLTVLDVYTTWTCTVSPAHSLCVLIDLCACVRLCVNRNLPRARPCWTWCVAIWTCWRGTTLAWLSRTRTTPRSDTQKHKHTHKQVSYLRKLNF